MDVESQFWNLVDAANELDANAWRISNDDTEEPVDSNRMVEPTYLTICKLVTDHPAERDVFVRCFSELVVQNRQSPWLLVPFCMRVLRMNEIKEVLHREMDRRGSGTLACATILNYCSSVMHAFHDDVWENATGFDTFAHELSDAGFDQTWLPITKRWTEAAKSVVTYINIKLGGPVTAIRSAYEADDESMDTLADISSHVGL